MKVHSAHWATWIVSFGLLFAGCQRPGVQAANDNGVPPGGSASLTSWDSDFLSNAAKAESRQTALSSAALKRAKSVVVKEYAQAVVDDYTAAFQQLSGLMKTKDVPQPVSLPEVKIEGADRLDTVSGGAFDHEFISLIAADQQQMAYTFRKAAETATDLDVRAYAKGVTPIIERNYDKAASIEKSLSGKPAE